jgi:hypothetical protein
MLAASRPIEPRALVGAHGLRWRKSRCRHPILVSLAPQGSGVRRHAEGRHVAWKDLDERAFQQLVWQLRGMGS